MANDRGQYGKPDGITGGAAIAIGIGLLFLTPFVAIVGGTIVGSAFARETKR